MQAVPSKNEVPLCVFLYNWHVSLCACNQSNHKLPLISSSVISSFVSAEMRRIVKWNRVDAGIVLVGVGKCL